MKGHARAPTLRQPVVDPRALAPSAAPAARVRPAADPGARPADGHSLRAAQRHSLRDAASRAGMRLRGNLLAAPTRLAGGRCLGAIAPRVAAPPARRQPHRLEPGRARQFLHRGKKGGAATGPNPTDRGRPGTKRHLVTDRHGIPLTFALTGPMCMTACPSRRCSMRSQRSAASVAGRDAGRESCTRTRPIIIVAAAAPADGEHHAARRPARDRDQRASRPLPLGHRMHLCLLSHRPQSEGEKVSGMTRIRERNNIVRPDRAPA